MSNEKDPQMEWIFWMVNLKDQHDRKQYVGRSCLPGRQRGSEASSHPSLLEESLSLRVGLAYLHNSD